MDIKRGDIIFVDFGDTIGSVQKGRRYAIVVSNNIGNKHSSTIMAVPTTTKDKAKLPTHFNIMIERDSTVLTENIMSISKKQVLRKAGSLSKKEIKLLNMCLEIALGL